jgi:hypothetical protein
MQGCITVNLWTYPCISLHVIIYTDTTPTSKAVLELSLTSVSLMRFFDNHNTPKTWRFHIGVYEDCSLLGYDIRYPVIRIEVSAFRRSLLPPSSLKCQRNTVILRRAVGHNRRADIAPGSIFDHGCCLFSTFGPSMYIRERKTLPVSFLSFSYSIVNSLKI